MIKKTSIFAISLSLMQIAPPPLSCCCYKLPAAEKRALEQNPAARVEAIGVALKNLQETSPGSLRELYLKCMLEKYPLSAEGFDYLQAQFLINREGGVREKDCDIILLLLAPPSGKRNESDWYNYQRMVDFKMRYPEEANKLKAYFLQPAIAQNNPVPAGAVKILCEVYCFIIEKQEARNSLRPLVAMIPGKEDEEEPFMIREVASNRQNAESKNAI